MNSKMSFLLRTTCSVACTLCSCADPLVATVGYVDHANPPKPEQQDGQGELMDAELDGAVDSALDDHDSAPMPTVHCTDLPDLRGAPQTDAGPVQYLDARGIRAAWDTFHACSDAGTPMSSIFYTRLDGSPILRANQPYSLRTSVAGAVATVFAGPSACEANDVLNFDIAIVGGCTPFQPKRDYEYIRYTGLQTLSPIIGKVSLCDALCPSPP